MMEGSGASSARNESRLLGNVGMPAGGFNNGGVGSTMPSGKNLERFSGGHQQLHQHSLPSKPVIEKIGGMECAAKFADGDYTYNI